MSRFHVPKMSSSTGLHRELPSDFKPINSNGHLRPYENGSLAIHNAHKSDSGFYMCAASNGIGPGISKVIKITVNGESNLLVCKLQLTFMPMSSALSLVSLWSLY